MKIGILTFHRAHNYGAVLQCYALQQYLCQLGHKAYVIDYNNRKLWDGYNWRDREYERQIRRNIIKLPLRLCRYIWYRRKQIIRFIKFSYYQNHILKLSNIASIMQSPYDIILIGSDQVWNPFITQGFDPYYWGVFDHPSKTRIGTYAASLMSDWADDCHEEIHNKLCKLDGISVREKKLRDYVKGLFPDLDIFIVPDPVFLLPPIQWKAFAIVPKYDSDYVFFYQAQTLDTVYDTAKEIAHQIGLPLITLSADARAINSIECHTASPQQFLGWILNAKLVVTSSFHALAFCILFQKDFYAINLNIGKDERLNNILSKFDLNYRLINKANECRELVSFKTTEIIKEMKEEAYNYLSLLLST